MDSTLPLAVKRFLDERPDVHIELRPMSTADPHRALQSHELDVEFGGMPLAR